MTDRETIRRLTHDQKLEIADLKVLIRAYRIACVIFVISAVILTLAIYRCKELNDSSEHRLNWTAETHIGCRVDRISDLRVCHWALPDGTTIDTRSM